MPYIFEMKQEVAWGDMDAFGHVNNVMYLRYFETGRVRFLKHLEELYGSNLLQKGVVVANLSCDFKAPVKFPDTLTLKVWFEKVGNSSFVMACDMVSERLGLAASARCTAVLFDLKTGKTYPVSDEMRKFLADLDASNEGK